MDSVGGPVPLDDASVAAQRQRLVRAWAASAPPDVVPAQPAGINGLALGAGVAVLIAAILGFSAAIRGFRNEKKEAEVAAAQRASASQQPPPPVSAGPEPAPIEPVTVPTAAPARAATAVVTPTTFSPPVTATTIPASLPAPTAQAANGAVTVTWPEGRIASLGPVRALRVSLVPSGGGPPLHREVPPTHRGTTVTGAANGTQYRATLTAVDTDGKDVATSPQSEPVTPTSGRPSPPGRVASVVATPVNGGVTVTWEPPASDGGSPVQRYLITANPGAKTVEAPWGVRHATVGDLASTTAYTLSVQAVTDAAYSEPLTSAPVQPATSGAGRPDPPSAPTVTVRADRSWTATFTPGSSAGGDAVRTLSFTVVPLPNDGTAATAVSPTLAPSRGAPTQVVVNGRDLPRVGSFTFVVVAWNGSAASDPSPPSSAEAVPSTTTTTAKPTATTTTTARPATKAATGSGSTTPPQTPPSSTATTRKERA